MWRNELFQLIFETQILSNDKIKFAVLSCALIKTGGGESPTPFSPISYINHATTTKSGVLNHTNLRAMDSNDASRDLTRAARKNPP